MESVRNAWPVGYTHQSPHSLNTLQRGDAINSSNKKPLTPQFRPTVAQSKNAAPGQIVKSPITPPVYRPQPTPQVLQRKAVTNQPVVGQNNPVAPAVYRPQPLPQVLQRKQLTANQMPTHPGIVQRKAITHSQVIQRAAAAAGFTKRPKWDQYPTATLQSLVRDQAAKPGDVEGYVVCKHCKKLLHFTNAHIDHSPIPWRRLKEMHGGTVPPEAAFDRSNLQLLCGRCDSSDAHNREMKDAEGHRMPTTREGLKRKIEASVAKKAELLGGEGGGGGDESD